MSQLLILVLGAACVGLVWAAYRSRKKEEEQQQEQRRPDEPNLTTLSAKDARRGDVVTIVGAGDDLEDLCFTVDRIGRNRSGREEWGEISGVSKNRRVFLEWIDDDRLELLLRRDDELSLADLGLSEQDLARFDEEESRDNRAVHRGTEYRYASSGEVHYSRDGAAEESYYAWDCAGEGTLTLGIEKWPGEPFVAGLSEKIAPHDVTLLRP